MNFETVIGLEVHVELKPTQKFSLSASSFWCRTKQQYKRDRLGLSRRAASNE